MKPHILSSAPLMPDDVALLRESFEVHLAAGSGEMDAAIGQAGDKIEAVVTIGQIGVSETQMAAMPNLRLVMLKGAGHEGVDLDAARRRGIAVTTGGGTNAVSVADHAMGLLLAVARGIVWADKRVREGLWAKTRDPRPLVSSKRMGIVGLGRIGETIARRAAGFDMEIAYFGPREKSGVPYRYFDSVVELAENSDFLMLSCPGGPATRGLVDRKVLAALGPGGFVVNVARASVIVPADLIGALRDKTIAGAALDLWEGEPNPDIPPELLEASNVVLSPHMGARSPETSAAAIKRITDNLAACFAGRPLEGQVA